MRRLLLALLLCLAMAAPAAAQDTAYRTGFVRWRAADGDFRDWQLEGVRLTPTGVLELDPQRAAFNYDSVSPDGPRGDHFYNGSSYLVGSAVSPAVPASFDFLQAVPSWNVTTPPGTWIELRLRVQTGGRWTQWYNLGVWSSDESALARHSVQRQNDRDGRVAVDTLMLYHAARAAQVKFRLFTGTTYSRFGEVAALPLVQNAALAISTNPPAEPGPTSRGDPAAWGPVLAVPQCSQMAYYDEGGYNWCSPTDTSMVVAYWRGVNGPCTQRVHTAVRGVFDAVYGATGNWPFNTAYAATHGLEAYVARLTSLADAEPWLAAGVPVSISYGWQRGELDNAPIPVSHGHLAILVGFDAQGDPVLNDPAAWSDADVRRTYPRAQIESLWLTYSGGTVYLIYPEGWPVPER